MLKKNVYLIGARGCGKSTVGKLLAQELGWAFVDADEALEVTVGRSVADIFAIDGEPAFRVMENAALQKIAANSKQVVATGGGVILGKKNRKIMGMNGVVVWLQADENVLAKRIWEDRLAGKNRPPLTQQAEEDPQASILSEVKAVLEIRTTIYRQSSELCCNVDGQTPVELAKKIAGDLKAMNTLEF